eukprot:TRINITY_DN65569_c0_g1_i1.p1 TRINITY_DN65569_c0_g1~~TRINITY_DN65569_c0_g1_i1.p1  ORF type:complete len:251 (+),score=23.97 TRINITY_DN65569_c0_g1_i1:37-789(+)
MSQNLVKYALTERDVLAVTNHPFIVKLNYAFQTNSKLFFLLDYCPGCDLSLYIEKEKKFTEDRARIYLAEILLAIQDLHKRDIIYRDLKPDNVVLNKDGHALLTVFGLSKKRLLGNVTAKFFCGSIAYLAPEMIKRSGHGKALDWYFLEYCCTKYLSASLPNLIETKKSCYRIFKEAFQKYYPSCRRKPNPSSQPPLNPNPAKRLGGGPADAEEIKTHKFFKRIKWPEVYARKKKSSKTDNKKKRASREE